MDLCRFFPGPHSSTCTVVVTCIEVGDEVANNILQEFV